MSIKGDDYHTGTTGNGIVNYHRGEEVGRVGVAILGGSIEDDINMENNKTKKMAKTLVQELLMMNPADVAFGAREDNVLIELRAYAKQVIRFADNIFQMKNDFVVQRFSGEGEVPTKSEPETEDGPVLKRRKSNNHTTNHHHVATVNDEGIIKQEQGQQQDEEEPAPIRNDLGNEEMEEDQQEKEVNKEEDQSGNGEGEFHQAGIVDENATKDIDQLQEEEAAKMKSTREDNSNSPSMDMMNLPLPAANVENGTINLKRKKYQQEYRQFKLACATEGLAEHYNGGPIDHNEPRKTRQAAAAGNKGQDYNTSDADSSASDERPAIGWVPSPPQFEEQVAADDKAEEREYMFCGVCQNKHYDPNDVSSSCEAYWIQCCNGTCNSWYFSAKECLGFSSVEAQDVEWRCLFCPPPEDGRSDSKDVDYCYDDLAAADQTKKKGGTIKTPSNSRKLKPTKSRSTRLPKDPAAPKRPLTSFFLFNKEMRYKFSLLWPKTHPKDMNKKLTNCWQNLPKEEKDRFEAAAEAEVKRYNEEMVQYNASKATSTSTAVAEPGASLNGSVAASSSAGGTAEDATHVVPTAINKKCISAEAPSKSETNDTMVNAVPAAYLLMEESETTAKSCDMSTTDAGSKSILGGVTGNNFEATNNKGSTTAPFASLAVASLPTHSNKKTPIQEGVCVSKTSQPNNKPGLLPEVSASNPYLTDPRGDAGTKPTNEGGTPGPPAVAKTKVCSPSAVGTTRVAARKPAEVIDLSIDTDSDSEDEED